MPTRNTLKLGEPRSGAVLMWILRITSLTSTRGNKTWPRAFSDATVFYGASLLPIRGHGVKLDVGQIQVDCTGAVTSTDMRMRIRIRMCMVFLFTHMHLCLRTCLSGMCNTFSPREPKGSPSAASPR